ncbi:uncharacterized protein lcorl isoform X1 [Takifugu rubripes]|nr:ligand-dependent nuclear receptor corepressor-like protein isoform X1 [Takifugu rubripes]
MATVQCSKCTAERKGFRRELDSWRHKLIHCVGFESILEGICGQMLLGDLTLHDGCQPEEVDDWIPAASVTQCSFCNLPLDKLADQAPSSRSPLSSPSDYSNGQAPTISESHQSAHRFLQAVFHNKDVHIGCDSNIPLVAQELMKKMVRQFALEYACKCLLNTSANGVTTRTSSPLSATADGPLDLTVSRTHEKDAQSEPDAVLDLSNRNSAASSMFSSTQKASGCLLPLPAEELGQPERRCHQSTALDALLSSLCPSHRSLLYQILKLAQQEKLLLFLNGRHAGRHCYCGKKTEEKVAPNVAPFHKSQSCCSYNPFNNCNGPGQLSSITHNPMVFKPNGSLHLYHFTNCKAGAHQASGCCCCLQTTGVETYTLLCPKRLHVISCPSLAVCNSNNLMCPLASTSKPSSLCTVSSSLHPSSTACCNQQKLHACHCYSNSFHVGENKTAQGVRDADPPCPVLKREQSPSPPPLSPIPSDVSKKCDEKPPSLLPHSQGEDDSLNSSHQEASMCMGTKQEQDRHPPTNSQSDPNPSVTILQDVMNRFSEKLETIRPAEKDPSLDSTVMCVSENEPPPSPSTSQKVHFHADAHLTEIITTVLHTGSASDYNLNELFNYQDSKDPKSPNTRSRRRQEVLAAMATPTHDAYNRRHTLQIKRELAMLDPSHTRRKAPLLKRAKSTAHSVTDGPKQETDTELEPTKNNGSSDGSLKFAVAECGEDEVKEEIKAVVITEEVLNGKSETEEMLISQEETTDAHVENQTMSLELQSICVNKGSREGGFQTETSTTSTSAEQPRKVGRPRKRGLSHSAGSDGINQESLSGPDGNSRSTHGKDGTAKDARRSGRKIVPPQRFSSFVTESKKMFFVACFSENIFNKEVEKDPALFQELDSEESNLKSTSENPLTTSAQHPLESAHEECADWKASRNPSSVQDKSPTKVCPDGAGCASQGAEILGRLRSTSKRLQDLKFTSEAAANISDSTTSATSVHITSNCQLPFTSPIKLMFVSPVQNEEGVRYSLKAAGPGCNGQAEDPFDPCEESSWSGTSRKHNSQVTELTTPQVKSVASPIKTVTSPSPRTASPFRAVSQPFKATSSPPTRSSPLSPSKLSSSPAKLASTALKSGSSPRKSPSSPAKSLRSASSSPKISPRRSGEGTPTKLLCDMLPFVESTPQKRRPGRPKKLRPQLEQKVKRPIGRPRKQKDANSVTGAKKSNGNSDKPSDDEDNANKNLKITVVYGRSRRNKRTVSEGFDQLQTEFRDACQAAGLKGDLGILMHSSNPCSGSLQSSMEPLEILNFVSPPKESATQSSSNIKCQKRDDSAPIRKPGRPAKVKISGISVTVTTVSPRQRKIQIRKNNRQAPETLIRTKVCSPQFKATKGPLAMHCKPAGRVAPTDIRAETKDEGKDRVAVRHSARVRKPSVHFLHAVATSAYRSYSRSNALLRRSKQLLLNKVSNERKQAEHVSNTEVSGEDRICGLRKQDIDEELSRMAGMTVDSIFSPKEALKWWAASAEEKTMNRELARRIRLISDTWVSDMVGNQGKETALNSKLSGKCDKKSRPPSVVRALFDCSPNKPRSCSMQQLCSWFMKTTETRSLAIVKKTSSRNPYEVMHFPRSGGDKSICHSPQTERLRKHVKKFAKIVPKSPLEHRLKQRRMRRDSQHSTHAFKRNLFPSEVTEDKQVAKWESNRVFSKYRATLRRARTRFLNQRDRIMWQRRRSQKDIADASNQSDDQLALGSDPRRKTLRTSKHYRHLANRCATSYVVEDGHAVDVPKEQKLCCQAWSPESLKECRVFLRKINSPDSELAEEEWDSCTVTLDDGSPSADLVAGRQRELDEVVKAVRKMSSNRPAQRKEAGSATGTAPERSEVPTKRQRGDNKFPGGVSTESPQPPPAKLLRQSRMKGLTGPRWCDFVFEN